MLINDVLVLFPQLLICPSTCSVLAIWDVELIANFFKDIKPLTSCFNCVATLSELFWLSVITTKSQWILPVQVVNFCKLLQHMFFSPFSNIVSSLTKCRPDCAIPNLIDSPAQSTQLPHWRLPLSCLSLFIRFLSGEPFARRKKSSNNFVADLLGFSYNLINK